MKKIVQFLFVPVAVGFVALVSGCSAPKPFVYTPNTEIKEGPGLLTGEKGEALLYDSKKKEGVLAPAVASVQQQTQQTATVSAPVTAADEVEFKKFQQWKQERQQLEDFEKWKQSPEGQKEYKEFQDWKQWKEYQKWREAHPDAK